MDDTELDRRLRANDPAGAQPRTLEATIDTLIAQPRRPRGRRWMPLAALGTAVAVVGVAVAATDIEAYLLSRPPFMTLDVGTSRTSHGLPYSPLTGADRGEDCRLYVELGGASAAETTAVDAVWEATDPTAFASAVVARMTAETEAAESTALQVQLLAELDPALPGIRWAEGSPSLHGWAVTCEPGIG